MLASPMQARLLVVAAALLFSTGGTAIKLVTLTSWQIACLRSVVAAVVLWLCFPAWRPRLDARTLVVASGYATTLVLFVTANTLTTAAHAIFLQSTAPLYVLVLGPRLLGEPLRRADLVLVVGIGLGLALILAAAQQPLDTAPDPSTGNWIAAVSGVAWAATLMGLRWLSASADPRNASSDPRNASSDARSASDVTGSAVILGNLVAVAVCAPWMFPLRDVSATDLGVLVFLGVVQIGLAYLCLVRGMAQLRAIESSLLLSAEPVLSALLAWAVHGESPAPLAVVGFVLIGAALAGQSATRTSS